MAVNFLWGKRRFFQPSFTAETKKDVEENLAFETIPKL